jgi:hypothetical protein
VTKQQNRDATVGGWGYKLCDTRLLILNGQTLGDKSREFICLANGGHNTIDCIVGSLVVWQAVTHLEVIIDDTCYCAIGGDSDHRLLCLCLNIDCSFVKPQYMVVIKNYCLGSNMINQKLKSISLP